MTMLWNLILCLHSNSERIGYTSNVIIRVWVKSLGPASTATCSHAAQLAAVLLCKSHQVILYYISNITNVSDYSLFQDLSGLCPSLHSLIFLAFSAEHFSNLDGDCLGSSNFCWCMSSPCSFSSSFTVYLKALLLFGISFSSEVSKEKINIRPYDFKDIWTLFLKTDFNHHLCLKWFKALLCVQIKIMYFF